MIDTYAYSYMKSYVYPEGEEGRKFYDQKYGDLLRAHPGFKGVILVGESCEFHSRDERTTGLLHLENRDENGNKIIVGKPNPGWFPCSDYPLLVGMIKDSIQNVKPDAELVFWTYNWLHREEDLRRELIRNIPKDVTLQVTFEMREKIEVDGVIDKMDDYALYFEGPGRPFISEAEIQNALATIPLVEFDSRLGFEPSMEYMTDRERIEWKVAVTRQVMDEEVTPLLKNNLCVKG